METGAVTLHQNTNYDSDDDMKDIEGGDRLDLLILDAEPKLDLRNMDPGIIFDHDNNASMGLMRTNVYMNNNMAGGTKNGNTATNTFHSP